MKEEDKKELQKFVVKLKKYAHRGNAKCNLEDCPEKCTTKHNLDLDTAIAWRAARHLSSYLFICEPEKLPELADTIWILNSIVNLHDRSYEKLYELLGTCHWFVFDILMR